MYGQIHIHSTFHGLNLAALLFQLNDANTIVLTSFIISIEKPLALLLKNSNLKFQIHQLFHPSFCATVIVQQLFRSMIQNSTQRDKNFLSLT